MKSLSFCLFLLSLSLSTIAQPSNYPRYNFVWKHGYGSYYNHEDWGAFTYDFRYSPPLIQEQYSPVDLFNLAGTICSFDGSLMCYSNALHILNGLDSIVENGDSMCLDIDSYQITENFESLNFPQHTIFLPTDDDSVYYCINVEGSIDFENPLGNIYQSYNRYFSKIDMRMNNGRGKVVQRDVVIKHDTLDYGKITACRHANGRDWWTINPKYESNIYFTALITPDGIVDYTPQTIGAMILYGIGKSIFTPDGSRYIRTSLNNIDDDATIVVFDFDRCTGELSNPVMIGNVPGYAECSGAVCSRDSRYLYIYSSYYVWQYDLWASDIEGSQILIASLDMTFGDPELAAFHLAQNAPDGTIIIASMIGNFKLGIIERPNKAGEACRLKQHHISIPNRNCNLPNHPNYNLGPIDGSLCDTLGKDNVPVAWFNPQLSYDTSEYSYDFLDLSIGAPTSWLWQFGDGSSSNEQEPTHTYTAPGWYVVCLTVSNENGSSSWCDTIQIGTSATTDWLPTVLQVYPNPATNYFLVSFQQPQLGASLTLRNALGEVVLQRDLQSLVSTVWVQDLASGVYFYTITAPHSQQVIQTGKIVKM